MPVSIKDTKLNSIYNQMVKANTQVDDSNVVQILAAVADSSKLSFAKALTSLAAPGITRQQQLDIVTKGLSAAEKKDLCAMLDGGQLQLSPSAKNFLEAVVGRATLGGGEGPTPPANLDPLKIVLTADQKNGLTGLAGPNVTIEAINLTTAPGQRLFNEDTFVVGQTDASGKFSGKMPEMQEGDVIRMRARTADGKVGDWVTIQAKGISASDSRNAVVALFRIGLADAGNGKIDVSNINGSRQISEPGAKLQFVNARTGEKTVVTIDDKGQMPAGLKLNGKPGDTFKVFATDGKNNTNFSVEAGPALTVPGGTTGPTGTVNLPDPALHKDELDSSGKPKFNLKRFTGPLFKDGIKPEDVAQGQLGDCYFPAAMAALAKSHPEVIENMIKDNGDGTYTVTFKKSDWKSGKFVDQKVTVDGDLYARAWGGPLYGSSTGDKSEKGMELWFPLIEKAYAQWKGSYDAIGNGGVSSDVWEACMGKNGSQDYVSSMGADKLWTEIKSAIDEKRPCGAGTYGEEEEAKYTNSGVYADHAYSILGYSEKDGVKYVTMRNPWGESEPSGDGKNDGIFNLKLDDFRKLYQTFMYVD
ncbi:MAG: C2 family cysteine protease [Myxococcales bacterium]